MAAIIGSLRAVLGIDTAQFQTGLKNARSSLGNFGKLATVGFTAVAAAGVAAAAALSPLVKSSIDAADEMGKMAQKSGVSVEALSRLNYAAKLSDVSLAGLGGGMRKLSQNMLAVAQGGAGPAATAFKALGISATNLDGSLRAPDQVLADVAEKFASMENGATKTALAVAIFGKSGADLIPMLNSGRDGLAAMANESDRLGLTLSQNTTRAAEGFNDNLTRLGGVFQGLVNHLTVAFLPSMSYIAQAMVDATKDGTALKAFAEGLVEVFKIVVTVGVAVGETIKGIGGSISTLLTATQFAQAGFQFWPLALETLKTGFTNVGESADGAIKFVNGLWSTIDTGPSGLGDFPSLTELTVFKGAENEPFAPIITNAGLASDAADRLKSIMAEGKSVTDSTRTAAEDYGATMQRLNELLSAGAINQDTYNRAAKQAQDQLDSASNSAGAWGSTIKSGFGSLFSDIKSGLQDGVSGFDALAQAGSNALGAIADKALSMAADGLFEILFGAFKGSFGGSFGGTALGSVGAGIGAAMPKFALGTNFAPGGLALVGERGPEVVNLPRGSGVTPNHDLDSLGQSRGGLDVTFGFREGTTGIEPYVESVVQRGINRNNSHIVPRLIQQHKGSSMVRVGGK